MTPGQLKELVIRISQHDDQEAFEMLFRYYINGLISFGDGFINNFQIVEELVEDVFVKVWENRQMLTTINNLSSYLYVATKYACLNFLRNNKNHKYQELDAEICFSDRNPESQIVHQENVDVIQSLIDSLPLKCQLIFKLIKEEEMTYAEVALLLNISVRTVSTQMTIAVAKLREGLIATLPELSSHYLKKSI